jgi:hypothetical protein
VLDDAFRALANYGGLKVLLMGHGYYSSLVSAEAMRDVVATAQAPPAPRQPFADLDELRIRICPPAMEPLVRLLKSVTRLSITIIDAVDDAAVAAPAYWHGLELLSRLAHLRKLCVVFRTAARVRPYSLRALSYLTELRHLELTQGRANTVSLDDVAELLRDMVHLRSLRLQMDMKNVSGDLPRVVGETCRRLRSLSLGPTCHLGVSLRAARETPLFPCLQSLRLSKATMPHMRRRR